jgi:hypothetical protein
MGFERKATMGVDTSARWAHIPLMPNYLTPAAEKFLAAPPAWLNTNAPEFKLAQSLEKRGLVMLTDRTVMRNGQVKYRVNRVGAAASSWHKENAK